MPIFDFVCEKCGMEHLDKYLTSSEIDEPQKCTATGTVSGKVVVKRRGRSVAKKAKSCGGKLIRLIGAPSPPKVHVGKHGDPRSKREQAHETKKKLLKRSYDHEFKKGSPGVEERRARIEQLKKQGVPVTGKHGF